jgi:hypothetical protein
LADEDVRQPQKVAEKTKKSTSASPASMRHDGIPPLAGDIMTLTRPHDVVASIMRDSNLAKKKSRLGLR